MSPAPVTGRVSIVILNWNSDRLGAAAVASSVAQSWGDVEVLVVDNASNDKSLEHIQAAHPAVTVLTNRANLGFGRGMNTGIAAATGEFVLPLNCDAALDPKYVETLVELLRAEPTAAAAGGLVASERVGASGPLEITAMMRTRNRPADQPTTCDKLNGACPLFRREALQSVIDRFGGPYDPTYDMYGEDIDLALTLRRLGWTMHFDPMARATHVRSYGSAPRVADRRGRFRVSTLANRHRNIIRHAPTPWVLRCLVALGQDIGFVVVRVAAGDLGAPADVTRAWRRVLHHQAADRRRRRELRRWG